jgi:hypothetical protein
LTNESPEGSAPNVTRRVLEAYTRDIWRAVARVDHDTMEALGVSAGDMVQIKGAVRSTAAKVFPLYPSDERKEIIRLDLMCRKNAGVSIGDNVTLQRARSVPAEKVVVVPLETLPPIDPRYLTDALESMPLVVDDNISIPYFGGKLYFKVAGVKPAGSAVVVTRTTVFIIPENQEAIRVSIDEYVGQEPEMDRAFVPAGADQADRTKVAAHFYLGIRLELSCGGVTEKIDYQKKLTAGEVSRAAPLASKYKEFAQAEV